jgi:hypothetical protein
MQANGRGCRDAQRFLAAGLLDPDRVRSACCERRIDTLPFVPEHPGARPRQARLMQQHAPV